VEIPEEYPGIEGGLGDSLGFVGMRHDRFPAMDEFERHKSINGI
jgi:hypothetical protein